jgi:hypothetical protein
LAPSFTFKANNSAVSSSLCLSFATLYTYKACVMMLG